jgi:hypothetical protein
MMKNAVLCAADSLPAPGNMEKVIPEAATGYKT